MGLFGCSAPLQRCSVPWVVTMDEFWEGNLIFVVLWVATVDIWYLNPAGLAKKDQREFSSLICCDSRGCEENQLDLQNGRSWDPLWEWPEHVWDSEKKSLCPSNEYQFPTIIATCSNHVTGTVGSSFKSHLWSDGLSLTCAWDLIAALAPTLAFCVLWDSLYKPSLLWLTSLQKNYTIICQPATWCFECH